MAQIGAQIISKDEEFRRQAGRLLRSGPIPVSGGANSEAALALSSRPVFDPTNAQRVFMLYDTVTSAGLAYGVDAALARHVPAWFAKWFLGVSAEDAYGLVRKPTVTSGVATATVP